MVRSRIAPTPSGRLHLGNLLNFTLTWIEVRKAGGSLRLRIDDLDSPRAKPEFVEDIFKVLPFLGLDWDEGPRSPEEQELQFSQRLRIPRYEARIQQLIETGKTFACSCSREELKVRSCPCRKRSLPLDFPGSALKIKTPDLPVPVWDENRGMIEVDLQEWMRDFVIRRRDGLPSYQVASLSDDLEFRMDLIVRGEDLLGSTGAQLFLADLLGETEFLNTRFQHHSLIRDAGNRKLSKTEGSDSIGALYLDAGDHEGLLRDLSRALGRKRACKSLQELLDR